MRMTELKFKKYLHSMQPFIFYPVVIAYSSRKTASENTRI